MPPKNSVKEYEEGAYYHIYNRGVEKRIIFLDEQDYGVFLSYLKLYLSPPHPNDLQGSSLQTKPRILNHSHKVTLHAYCLMPNHFHVLLKQQEVDSMNHFMRSLLTKYSMYFNAKYDRVGRLFQGIYKAVKVASEEQLLYLTKYIHLNPTGLTDNPATYPYSSLNLYLDNQQLPWINPTAILDYFSNTNQLLSYQSFIFDSVDNTLLPHLAIDQDDVA